MSAPTLEVRYEPVTFTAGVAFLGTMDRAPMEMRTYVIDVPVLVSR